MTPTEYLKRPYTYCLIWDEGSRTWTGTIKEFPGCIAQGDTWSIMFKLRRAAKDWIAAALDLGQEVPSPSHSPHNSATKAPADKTKAQAKLTS